MNSVALSAQIPSVYDGVRDGGVVPVRPGSLAAIPFTNLVGRFMPLDTGDIYTS